jgi:hypothetical protein
MSIWFDFSELKFNFVKMLYLPYGLSDFSLQTYLFHPSYVSSVFFQYFFPLLCLPLSHFAASASHVLNGLTLRSAHPAPSRLLFRPIPITSLLVPASESRHHSLALSLSRYTGTSSVMHLSYSLLYLNSLILSLLSCLSVPLSLSSALVHLPSALILSTSPLAYPFLLQYFSLSFSSSCFFFAL